MKMSENSKAIGKANKNGKSSLRTLMNPGNLKPPIPAFVPPILREVGKLAAGVASVSTSNISSSSATGNPRNKVALQPGHSLMDWVRLGTSGKDLTGLGSKAGTLNVTKQELARHNKRDDAWLAIRGRVYNVTEYFAFHPGGEEELMKGAGVDATQLFDQVHPWVNYEQILQKCLVGKLVTVDPNLDTKELFFGNKRSSPSKSSVNRVEVTSANSLATSRPNDTKPTSQRIEEAPSLPRFDWIQKLDYITIIFYTKAFSNPLVEINCPLDDQTILVTLTYQDAVFKNELVFYDKIRWPCDVNVSVETGKVELIFRKSDRGIWENYGVLRQQSSSRSGISAEHAKAVYVLKKKVAVNHNTWLLKYDRKDGRKIVTPVGKHIRVFGFIDGQEESRSYTPVPESLFDKFDPNSTTKDILICLMVKQYPNGKISQFITAKNLEEEIQFSKSFGNLDLKVVEKREMFLFLAAGTGITPMLSLIAFLLERRIKKCQFIRLLFFNRTEKDILIRNQLEELTKSDKRFKIDNILSEPSESWTGHKGHVTSNLIESCLNEHLRDTGYTIKDIFTFICGPPKFGSIAMEELRKIQITEDQLHLFEG